MAAPAWRRSRRAKAFKLDGLRDYLVRELPSYARPLFVRMQPAIETTGTFKYRKVDLVRDGFDPAKIEHELYFDHPDEHRYVRDDAGPLRADSKRRVQALTFEDGDKVVADAFEARLAAVRGFQRLRRQRGFAARLRRCTRPSLQQARRDARRSAASAMSCVEKRTAPPSAGVSAQNVGDAQALAQDRGQPLAHRAPSNGACCASARAKMRARFFAAGDFVHAALRAAR